ncbi:hypothetical protein G9A89_022307 [Geosiphon pyriformis]|nr:hypothetical protein G9A89_022307 [Geosiphon pyriformis]
MEFGFNISVKSTKPRKKKKGGALENNIGNWKFTTAKVPNGCFWSSETGNTTKSDSVDIEEECLVEKTSFNYGDDRAFTGGNLEQTSKSSKIQTKRALDKPLGKIDFLDNNNDNIFLNKPVVLSPLLKNLINVSVRKFFALDIGLDKVTRKSSQKKCAVVRKLFSGINDFGGASTPSKFAGIIKVTFTSELSLVQAFKKAEEAKILVNSDLKKSTGHSDQAVVLKKIPVGTSVEAVHAVLFEFGSIKSIKMQLYTKCGKTGHISLGCSVSGSLYSGRPSHMSLLDMDKSRLAAIYPKHLASIACPVAFSGISWTKIAGGSSFSPLSVKNGLVNPGFSLEIKPTLSVVFDIEKNFSVLESSLISFIEQISKLAKRLDLFVPAVFQPSFGCQLPVTLPSQNQVGNIVMGKGSGEITGDETAVNLDFSASSKMKKLENMLEELSALVLSLTARFDGLVLAGGVFFKSFSQ